MCRVSHNTLQELAVINGVRFNVFPYVPHPRTDVINNGCPLFIIYLMSLVDSNRLSYKCCNVMLIVLIGYIFVIPVNKTFTRLSMTSRLVVMQ